MPVKGLPDLEFRSPVVIFETRDGRKIGLQFSDTWQRKLEQLWQFIGALQTHGNPSLFEGGPGDGGLGSAMSSDALLLAGAGDPPARPAAPPLIAALFDAPPAPPPRPAHMLWGEAPRKPNFTTIIRDTAANLANYPAAAYEDAYYIETDTYVTRYSSGTAWVEILMPALVKFLGSTNSFPALKRSAAILQARLADDSAHTDLEVADEAYDATAWNGSLEAPTKNALRDKLEQLAPGLTDALISDDAFGAGWNGDTSHGASRNALYDLLAGLFGSSAYTPTNVTPDRSYDANATSVDELADVLGTVIADLQAKGILS